VIPLMAMAHRVALRTDPCGIPFYCVLGRQDGTKPDWKSSITHEIEETDWQLALLILEIEGSENPVSPS
jgi:hypothetical protein